jgi:hypothetical protein
MKPAKASKCFYKKTVVSYEENSAIKETKDN